MDSVRLVWEHMFVSPRELNWEEVRAFYEAGHTMRECKARFGFSNDAWSKAAAEGKITPRVNPKPKLRHDTREAIRELLEQRLTQSAIAVELNLSKPTVSYHVRRLGIPPDERAARRFDWAEIQKAHDEGLSARECQARFGFASSSWYEAIRRGELVVRPRGIPIEELLVAGRPRNRGHIRQRLLKAGLKEERCERCGLDEWMGAPLRVTLHHVNGDQHDHRLENLQFLCPNCHSQTPNFAGRNGRPGPRSKLPPVSLTSVTPGS
jgi:hypothetical protein